jgi:hypothetical protein
MAAVMDNEETIGELRAALAELESGEGLSRFVEGHGLQSRVFAFSWESEGLSIDFELPCERVLSDEEDQALDAARVGAALRMAILLLSVAADGKLLAEGEARISVSADEDGARYAIVGPDGEEIDAGEDWDPLVARLDAALPDGDDVQIIWP